MYDESLYQMREGGSLMSDTAGSMVTSIGGAVLGGHVVWKMTEQCFKYTPKEGEKNE